jgi:2Fe-2S ferredoxin
MNTSPHITITCLPSHRKIRTPKGSNVFAVLRKEGIPIAFSCSGEGICAKCVLDISPQSNVTPESNLERKRKEDNRINPDLRISCLCKAKGDITVQASYW